jgi:two-component system, cell cycle sensor histidine kinase and response regulator CckA
MQTILIAEDDTAIRKMLSEVLRNAGYQILAAGSGRDAVAAASRHEGKIDLLLTDIVMAGMGGADLYAWLKTERPDLQVLFISGYMSREPLEGAFLKKPFSPAELLQKVREVLMGGHNSVRSA